MPTERGPEPATCPACGTPVHIHGRTGEGTGFYRPVKPWEDPAAVERVAVAMMDLKRVLGVRQLNQLSAWKDLATAGLRAMAREDGNG